VALLAAAGLGVEAVDEVDDVEEAAAGAVADQRSGDGDGQVRLACSGAADEHHVALVGDEAALRQIAHQAFVHRRAGEVEVLDVLGQRQLGDGELVADRARLLLGDLRLQQVTDDALRLVLALDAVANDLVICAAHPVELEAAHQFQNLCAFHLGWLS